MNTLPGLIGKKLGFTQVFDASGNVARVTVVEAGPCVVVRKRTEEKDGYTALQLSFGERRAKLTSKPLQGYFDKSKAPARTIKNKQGHDIQVYPRTLKEIRLSAEEAAKYNEGDVLTASDIFKEGQFVDVSGTTIGRGFSASSPTRTSFSSRARFRALPRASSRCAARSRTAATPDPSVP